MKKTICSLILASAVLVGCDKKKEEPKPTPGKATAKEIVIDATAYEKFVYFSFAEGKVLPLTDEQAKTDKTWDLAFHRYDFRTNSGMSGGAKGGAFRTEATDINAKVQIPSAGSFQVDGETYLLMKFDHTTQPPTISYVKTPANLVLTTARSMKMKDGKPVMNGPMPVFDIASKGTIFQDMSAHGGGRGPTVTLDKKVYLVRTASGKYAKILITAHNSEKKNAKTGKLEPTSGMIAMTYVYPVE